MRGELFDFNSGALSI